MSIGTNAAELKKPSTIIWKKVVHYEIPYIGVTDGPRRGYDDIADDTLTATRKEIECYECGAG